MLGLFGSGGTTGDVTNNFYGISQYASIAALKGASAPADGTKVVVGGYYADGDGGGGVFYYDAGSSDTDNGGTIIAPTAGAGRWKRIYSGAINVKWFGAKGDGTTDDTVAIQVALNSGLPVYIPGGGYAISDSLKIGTMAIINGEGPNSATITGTGMTGKSGIIFSTKTEDCRVRISGFRLTGDFDTALDLSVNSGKFVYNSRISDLYLLSAAGSALYIPTEFSTTIDNVSAGSTSGNGFELSGNVATTLTNCYATTCGSGKAGYRIYEQALMVGCNGVNSGSYWGCFGKATAVDGSNKSWAVVMNGCNIEDFSTAAIELRYTGRLSMYGCSFVPPAIGTFVTLLDGKDNSTDGLRILDVHCSYASKGSTMSGASRILSRGIPNSVLSISGVFTDLYRYDQSMLYDISASSLSNPAYLKYATKYSTIDFQRGFGFNLQPPTLWTANATNFSALRIGNVKTANTAPTNLDYASGGELGQRLTIIVQDANTTIKHNSAFSGRFLNTSAADITAANGGVYEYVHNGTNWVQR